MHFSNMKDNTQSSGHTNTYTLRNYPEETGRSHNDSGGDKGHMELLTSKGEPKIHRSLLFTQLLPTWDKNSPQKLLQKRHSLKEASGDGLGVGGPWTRLTTPPSEDRA